jgi:hypothetical protein
LATIQGNFGTAFATAGFSADPNISPNNQAFAASVIAVVMRNGTLIEQAVAPFLPGGFNGFGNPTNKVSGTATNGTSTLAMRQDGAPALDWAQGPTWTGTHAWTPVAGATAITVSSVATGSLAPMVIVGAPNVTLTAGTAAVGVLAMSSSTAFFGLAVQSNNANANNFAGISLISFGNKLNNSDFQLYQQAQDAYLINGGTGFVYVYANSAVESMRIGTGTILGRGPVSGMTDMTPDTGSFTGSLTGMSNTGTATLTTVTWSRQGNQVFLAFPNTLGTSNATTMTMTGLPAALQPTREQGCMCTLVDSGNNCLGWAFVVGGSGTITFDRGTVSGSQVVASTFTASGQKGVNFTAFAYMLN